MFYDLGLTLTAAIQGRRIEFRLLRAIIKGYENERKLTAWEKEHLFECLLFGAPKYFCWGNDDDAVKYGQREIDTELTKTVMNGEAGFYKRLRLTLPTP